MKPSSSPIRLLWLSLLLFAAPDSRAAAPQLSAQASANGGAPFLSPTTGSTGPVSQSNTNNSSHAFGLNVARATADFGVLKVYGEAQTNNLNSLGSLFGAGTAFWQDNMVINASGLTGTAGSVPMKFTMTGGLTSTQGGAAPIGEIGSARASYDFYLNNLSSPIASATETVRADGSTSGSFLGVEQVILVNFIFGTPFDIKLSATARGDAYIRFGGSSVADLEHTVNWGGFGTVLDAGNAPVAGYSLTSGSGTDFAQPVPEPSSALLLGLTGAVLAGRRRRPAK